MVCGGEVVKNSRRKVAARQTGDENVQHDGAVCCSLHKVDCCVVKAAPEVEGVTVLTVQSSCTDVPEHTVYFWPKKTSSMRRMFATILRVISRVSQNQIR